MFESYGDEPIYNVKAVVGQSGVSASTLRAWERRYGVPIPPRNTNGYRLYSARDIAIIRWLKTQVDAGMSISQAVNLMQLEPPQPAPLERTDLLRKDLAWSGSEGVRNINLLHDELVQCAVNYDESGAEKILSEAFSLYPVEAVCLQLLQPVLVTMGERWHRGETSISAEHFITNIIRRKLLALISACPPPTRNERIIIGCAPEEFHEIGILLLALFLRRRGLSVVYLGQNVAIARLEETLTLVHPAMVIMSATTMQSAAHLLAAAELLASHKAHSVTIAYGGLIFRRMELMRQHIPAIYLGDDLVKGIDRAITILDNPGSSRIQHTPVSPAVKAAADNYDLNMPEIVVRTTHEILTQIADLNATMHQQVFELSRQFALALATALRFGEPELLNQLIGNDWEVSVMQTPSTETEELLFEVDLVRYIARFRTVISQLATKSANTVIQPYLDAMKTAR